MLVSQYPLLADAKFNVDIFTEKTFVHLTALSEEVRVTSANQDVFLTILVYAYPEPRMIWYRDDEEISESDRHYEIRSVESWVRVTEKLGQVILSTMH